LAQLIGAELLGAVLDDAVHQRANDGGGVAQVLFHAQRGVEVADRDGGFACSGDVDHHQYGEEQGAGDRPEEALAPAAVPGDDEGEQRGDEDRDGQVVVKREQVGAGDADEE